MTMLHTIGYEGAALPDMLATLLEAVVNHVIDVRELPQSRRPGFSKNALSSALAEVGIGYRHVRALGDPKPGREAARRGDMAGFKVIFERHLALEPSQEALRNVAEFIRGNSSVLLCYERDPKHCHRSLVANELSALTSLQVRHLGVATNAAKGARVHVGSAQHARAC